MLLQKMPFALLSSTCNRNPIYIVEFYFLNVVKMMLLILLQDGQHVAWLAQAVLDTSAFN